MRDVQVLLPPTSQAMRPVVDRKVFAISLALFAGTFLLYARVLQNGFINYDDPAYVTANQRVQQGISVTNIGWAFATTTEANWHPLTWVSHLTDVTLFGANPAGHHFTNVLFHACNAVLLFLLLYWATRYVGRSLLVAVLFAAHPLNVETVAWIAERKSVLSTFFFFLAIAAYAGYVRKTSTRRYLLVAMLFAFGLMAKPMIITLPCLLLVLDYWPLERIPVPGRGRDGREFVSAVGKCFLEKIPLFVLSAASAVITIVAQYRDRAVGQMALLPMSYRVENAIYSYVDYIAKAIWPTHLAVFYPHPEGRLSLTVVVLCALALILFTYVCWRYREQRYFPAGWLWYLGTLAPVIGILQVGRQAMADRYAYIPLIGIFVVVVWSAAAALQNRVSWTAAAAVSSAIVLTYAALTFVQISYWKSSYKLFQHALAVTRENGTAELNFGEALASQGQTELAKAHLRNAFRYSPDLGLAHYNLATILQRENRASEALEQYQLAIPRMSDALELGQAHNNLGALYLQQQKYPEALAQFTAAIQSNPAEQNSYMGRGLVLFELGQFDGALASFTRATELAPSPLAWFWIGRCQEARGEKDLAIRAYLITLRLAPQFGEARTRLNDLQGPGMKP